MCGIIAYFHPTQSREGASKGKDALYNRLQHAATVELKHRGPDDVGVYLSEDFRLGISLLSSCSRVFLHPSHIGLGHARLSIIDVESGHQPLHSVDGTVHAVVNGELYDYAALRARLEESGCIFQTRSDSELVIHL